MSHSKYLLGVSLLVLTLASPALAQTDTTTTPAPDTTTTSPDATTKTPDTTATTGTTAGTTTTVDPAAPAPDASTPTAAVDCEGQFTSMDADGNGYLTDSEAPQAFARARVNDKTIAAEGLTHEDYITACSGNEYAQVTPEEGAPFEGANSFTMEQAKDRAVAWGVTDVSDLTLDDKGIWRGNGKVDGATMAVAVDFKGNVVTSVQ